MRYIWIIFFTLTSFLGGAQETTSEISGRVVNEKREGLAGATVEAVHTPTGTKYTTTTRTDGRYNLINLRVGGPYQIKISYVGFQQQTQSDVFLSLGIAYKADFDLAPDASSLTEVTVTTTRSDKVFSKSRTGSAEVINRQQMDRLPTINRSINDFTRLTPTANSNAVYGTSSF